MEHLATIIVAAQYAAALAVFAGIVTTLGQGQIASKAIESIARQPEAAGKIRASLMLGLAFTEMTALLAFVIAIFIINA